MHGSVQTGCLNIDFRKVPDPALWEALPRFGRPSRALGGPRFVSLRLKMKTFLQTRTFVQKKLDFRQNMKKFWTFLSENRKTILRIKVAISQLYHSLHVEMERFEIHFWRLEPNWSFLLA